jgi:hypothetical protein
MRATCPAHLSFLDFMLRSYRRISLIPRLLVIFRNMINFLRCGVVSTLPNPKAGRPPLVGCPQLLVQYIRSYPPYLEPVPPSVTWGRAMPWWQHWTHLSWNVTVLNILNKTQCSCEVRNYLEGPRRTFYRWNCDELSWSTWPGCDVSACTDSARFNEDVLKCCVRQGPSPPAFISLRVLCVCLGV